MPKISRVEIFKTDIPFKTNFAHALKKRASSESIFVKVVTENEVTGFGEALPRSYVTGNSRESVFEELSAYAKTVIGLGLDEVRQGVDFIKNMAGIEAEGRCALEIALLDCLGKSCAKPVSELLREPVNTKLVYSFVISAESLLKAGIISIFARSRGYNNIKVKVGTANDKARVRLCRILMPKADIRVDANGAWDVPLALSAIESLRPFKISCIEQPVPKEDIEGMREVSDFCQEPVMADESLCTREDALKLAQIKACDMFNVRLSKCGGIFRSLDIIDIATDYEMGYQIGCLVGESGILSAAARHMASVVKNFAYFEGSYSRLLLKEDIIKEDLTPVKGIGYTLRGPGLGVRVREDILRKYTEESVVV